MSSDGDDIMQRMGCGPMGWANFCLIIIYLSNTAIYLNANSDVHNLISTPERNVKLFLSDGPFVRQKPLRKASIVKFNQLLDTAELAMRAVNLRHTNT
jgi:hypothetical protein